MSIQYYLGLDVGGTKIEGALIQVKKDQAETHYEVLGRQRIPTEREKGYEYVLNNMASLIKKICQENEVPLRSLQNLGLGLPGAIDPQTQQMQNGNTAIFIQRDIIGDLKTSLKKITGENVCPITIENDANCFALAEVVCGVGRTFFRETKIPIHRQIGIGIILGTGTGGGAMLEGKLYRGRHGGGLEIGHTQLHSQGPLCFCGRHGCAEIVLSGTGVERRFAELSALPLKASEIFAAAVKQDPLALQVLDEYRFYLLQFLINLTNIFDPDYFVLGGGVSMASPIYEEIEENLARFSFIPKSQPRVFQNTLGDSAGVIGAALLTFL